MLFTRKRKGRTRPAVEADARVSSEGAPGTATERAPQPQANLLEQYMKAKAAERKATPLWRGVMMYFPLVWEKIAEVSKKGNDQHNPGQPLHWSRGKSDDHLDSAMRHMLDYGRGNRIDDDGAHHLAKAIWRLCAELQIDLEKHEHPGRFFFPNGFSIDIALAAPAQQPGPGQTIITEADLHDSVADARR